MTVGPFRFTVGHTVIGVHRSVQLGQRCNFAVGFEHAHVQTGLTVCSGFLFMAKMWPSAVRQVGCQVSTILGGFLACCKKSWAPRGVPARTSFSACWFPMYVCMLTALRCPRMDVFPINTLALLRGYPPWDEEPWQLARLTSWGQPAAQLLQGPTRVYS